MNSLESKESNLSRFDVSFFVILSVLVLMIVVGFVVK